MSETSKILLDSLKENQGAIKAQRKNKDVNNLKKRTYAGVIGVGASGGNVAHLLTGKGYVTAALNTTSADMADINVDVKVTIDGIDGSGKDRAFSATQFKKSYKNFFNHDKIQELLEHDIIFVVGSGGGGTGTIISVMVAGFLKNEFPNKIIFIVGLLGSIKEDRISQNNMREFMSDLENKSAGCPYLLFDNNRVKDRVGDDVYDVVNNDAVNGIRLLSKEFFVENARSNIDGRDYARLTNFKGLTAVVAIDDLNISVVEETVDLRSRVEDAISKSTAIVTKNPDAYGFFMNTGQAVYNMIDTTFDDIQASIGHPTAGLVFRHLQNSSGQGPQMGVIMTGMEAPVERFNMIERRIEEYDRIQPKANIPEVDRSEGVQNLAGDSNGGNSTGSGGGFLDNF